MAKVLTFFIVFTFIQIIVKAGALSSLDEPFYTAGVVEFRPAQFEHTTWTPRAILEDNLNAYTDIILSENAKETDIIVFPEMTLNTNEEATFVPDPTGNVDSPCDNKTSENGEVYHDFLVHLSCLARNVSKYIVVNICEKAFCEPETSDPRPCATTGLNIFNTNVVFDRNGVVISRYRKVHLWGEPRNTTLIPSYGYFDTDFGVRFGHFVCFDLLFYMPAQEMVEKFGIRDFIFPTMWFSQLPFLTGVQIQSAWSYANDVNFLAAGASYPPVGTSGTGIYSGRLGTLQAVMNRNQGERKLFVAKLQKKTPSLGRFKRDLSFENIEMNSQKYRRSDDIYLKRDDLESYETLEIYLNDSNSLQKELCQLNEEANTKFCCHFDLQWSVVSNDSIIKADDPIDRYYYRLGVYNGRRREQAPESNNLRTCALIACVSRDITDCGKIFDYQISTRVIFERLVIQGSFPNASEVLLMPNSLKEDLLPVAVPDFEWEEVNEGSTHKVRFALKTPISNLLTFSIYGNYYDSNATDEKIQCESSTDLATCKDNGASSTLTHVTLILLCAILSLF